MRATLLADAAAYHPHARGGGRGVIVAGRCATVH